MPRSIGFKHSNETKQKMREKALGRVISLEAREKMSLVKTGKPSGRKGLKFSDRWRKNLSKAHMGNIPSQETRKKMTLARIGKKRGSMPEWWRLKAVAGRKGKMPSGSNHYLWKTERSNLVELHRKRGSSEYRQWRKNIFERDNYICQECDKRGGYLQAHHIVRVKDDLSRLFDINNGITLCRPCHKKTLGKEKQFEEKYFSIVQKCVQLRATI